MPLSTNQRPEHPKRKNRATLRIRTAGLALTAATILTGCTGIQSAKAICIDIKTTVAQNQGPPLDYAHVGCIKFE